MSHLISLEEALTIKESGALDIKETINNNGIIKIIFNHKKKLFCLEGYEVKFDKVYFEKEPYEVVQTERTIKFYE